MRQFEFSQSHGYFTFYESSTKMNTSGRFLWRTVFESSNYLSRSRFPPSIHRDATHAAFHGQPFSCQGSTDSACNCWEPFRILRPDTTGRVLREKRNSKGVKGYFNYAGTDFRNLLRRASRDAIVSLSSSATPPGGDISPLASGTRRLPRANSNTRTFARPFVEFNRTHRDQTGSRVLEALKFSIISKLYFDPSS